MKLWERNLEARLREVKISEQMDGFMLRQNTIRCNGCVEKYREGQKEFHCVVVNLKKTYDRVLKEEMWYCMRNLAVLNKNVLLGQDMYEDRCLM